MPLILLNHYRRQRMAIGHQRSIASDVSKANKIIINLLNSLCFNAKNVHCTFFTLAILLNPPNPRYLRSIASSEQSEQNQRSIVLKSEQREQYQNPNTHYLPLILLNQPNLRYLRSIYAEPAQALPLSEQSEQNQNPTHTTCL